MYSAKSRAHQTRDLRIELDGLDAAGAVLSRTEDLETAARTHDEHGSAARQPDRRARRCCRGETRGAIGSSVAAVIASMPSPSVKRPSCGGGSFAAIRLKPGACRSGTRGLSITSMRPSGLERVCDDSRRRDAQRLAQGLVLTRVRAQPMSGHRRRARAGRQLRRRTQRAGAIAARPVPRSPRADPRRRAA